MQRILTYSRAEHNTAKFIIIIFVIVKILKIAPII